MTRDPSFPPLPLTLARDVTRAECPWLPRDFAAGEVVYSYGGYTYGCIGEHGYAISLTEDEAQFLEMPRDALLLRDGETVAEMERRRKEEWDELLRGGS